MNRMRRQKHRRLLPWFDLCRCLHRHSNDAYLYYRDNQQKETTVGIFDKDPKYQELKAIRDSGYKGAVNQNGKKVGNVDKWINQQQSKGKK